MKSQYLLCRAYRWDWRISLLSLAVAIDCTKEPPNSLYPESFALLMRTVTSSRAEDMVMARQSSLSGLDDGGGKRSTQVSTQDGWDYRARSSLKAEWEP